MTALSAVLAVAIGSSIAALSSGPEGSRPMSQKLLDAAAPGAGGPRPRSVSADDRTVR